MSKSMRHTFFPMLAYSAARFTMHVVFPVPPLYEWKAITFPELILLLDNQYLYLLFPQESALILVITGCWFLIILSGISNYVE